MLVCGLNPAFVGFLDTLRVLFYVNPSVANAMLVVAVVSV